MGEDVSLDIPRGVTVHAIMDFLERGHGYTWKTVSKKPVLMVLGHPSKSDHPEVVIMKESLVISSPHCRTISRMEAMLDVLVRQAVNGSGGMT